MHFTTRQKFILATFVLLVGGAMLFQYAVRSELLVNITSRFTVTDGLIAHYTFDGRDVNMALASAEVRTTTGALHANMVNATSGRFASASVDAENADTILNGTSDSDFFGISAVSDVNADGYDDVLVGAPNASDTGTERGRAYLFYGPLSGSIDAENADVIINGTNDGDWFGTAISSEGDVNADGYNDIIIGAFTASDTGNDRGRVYLFYGPLSGSVNAEDADAIINGTDDLDQSGLVSSAGDVNSDGYDDVIVSSQLASDTGTERGRAYLFYGPLSGSIDAENADVIINGTNDGDWFSDSPTSVGDVNGDGYGDILVGARYGEDTGDGRGRAYLFYGPLSGSIDAENADAIMNGTDDDDSFGYSASNVGDVNADGYDDVLVGASNASDTGNDRGRVYLFYGPLLGSIDAENADVIINGTNDLDGFSLVSSAGDVNSDGYDDILVGSQFASDAGTMRGRVYLFYGPLSGSIDAENADVIFNGTDDNNLFAAPMSSPGDINTDGYDDIVIGAYGASDVGTLRGRAYIFMPLAFGTRATQGKLGQGMEFEGRHGYVDVGNTASTIRSVSFWMKADDVTDRVVIAYNGTASTSINGSSILTTTGFSSPTTYINSATTSTTLRAGEWYHVVVTDATGVSASDLRIGGNDTAFFDGTLDDVRFYDKVLSEDEIRQLALLGGTMKTNVTPRAYSADDPLGRGLAGHWSFDGPTMSTVAGITRVQDLDPLPYGTFTSNSIDAENAGTIINAPNDDSCSFGCFVSSVGDVNADGYEDILASSIRDSDTGTQRGRAYLAYGPLTGSINQEDADAIINGTNNGDWFGTMGKGAGDVNADGYDDILVGAPFANEVGTATTGKAYLFYGPVSGSINAEDADVIITGTNDDDAFGYYVSLSGDINNDGYDDVLVSAGQASDTGSYRGRAYLFLGPLMGAIDAENADAIFNGTNDVDFFGATLFTAGDINADGYDDILVGSPFAEDTGTDQGRAYLFLGPLTGSINAEDADAIFNGTNDDDFFSISVSAGDVNADGYDDILVGASNAEDAGTDRGRAYLFLGPVTGSIDAENADAIINGTTDNDSFSESLSFAGDVNADGMADILVGATGASDTGTERGRAYLFYAPISGSINAENADVIFNGTNDIDYFGSVVSFAGDINADGYEDILVGAKYAEDAGTDRGRIYFFTPTATSTHTATVSGATPTFGKLGQALDFNGTSDYVSGGDVGPIRSVSFWIKADDTTTRKMLNMNGTAHVELDGSSQVTGTSWSNPTYYVDAVLGNRTLTTDWHHVVITSTTSIDATTFEMGRVGGSYFDGMIDDVRIFNRTLSLDDVRALNLMGNSFKVNTTNKPAKPRTVVPAPRMTGHWTFDGGSITGNYATVTNAVTYRLGMFGATSVDAENANSIQNGTNDTDYFGRSVSSAGDVNADGYDDIIVGAYAAEDVGTDRGRAYLFYGPLAGGINAEDADAIFNGTNDTDYFGASVSNAGDINTDGYDDILIGAYLAEDSGNIRGRAYLFFGPLSGSVNAENADVIFNGVDDDDIFGSMVASAGDVNADGYDDIIIAADEASDTGTDRGQVYLFYGPLDGSTPSVNAEDADAIINGTNNTDWFGYTVSSAGDVNADGYDDILVGAKYAEDTGADQGRAYLFHGPLLGNIDAENADAILNGTYTNDFFSSVTTAGDVNADGYPDILVGASDSGDTPTDRGRAYLFYSPLAGSIDAENADAIIQGTNNSDYLGMFVSPAGDVNADGYDDILVSALSAEDTGTDRGRAYLFYGPLAGDINAEDADAIFNGTNNYDFFGVVASAGDVNADGYDDILVGSDAEDTGTDRGRAYLFTPTAETLRDGTITDTTPTFGKIGQAFDFNGTSAHVSAGNVGSVQSVSFWLKADDTTTRKVIDLNGTAQIELDGSSQITATSWTSPTYYLDNVSGGRTINGEWHHVVITTATPITASTFDIGRVSSSYFDGLIDDVRIFNYALSADEVQALYLTGK